MIIPKRRKGLAILHGLKPMFCSITISASFFNLCVTNIEAARQARGKTIAVVDGKLNMANLKEQMKSALGNQFVKKDLLPC